MQQIEKRVYSIDEVSELLQISRNLTYRLVRQKQLPGSIHLGPKRMCVSKAAIDKLLDSENSVGDGNGRDNGHSSAMR